MIAAIALAAQPALQELRLHGLAVVLGALALALLTGGLLFRSGPALGWALAALGGEYAVLFAARGDSYDEWTPLYAAVFLLVAELAFWSVEPRLEAWSEPDLLPRRAAFVAGACAGAAGLAALVVVAGAVWAGGGVALDAIGVAAVVGALMLLAALVRPFPERSNLPPLR